MDEGTLLITKKWEEKTQRFDLKSFLQIVSGINMTLRNIIHSGSIIIATCKQNLIVPCSKYNVNIDVQLPNQRIHF